MTYFSPSVRHVSLSFNHRSGKILFKIQKLLFFCLTFLLLSLPCMAQGDWATEQDWEKIKLEHSAGFLHDTAYLIKAQALTEDSFKDPSLKEKLAIYREIAWNDIAYQPFRVKYFAFLANHATLVHKEGFAIYYLGKMEEELRKIKPYVNSLNQPRLLLAIYGQNDYTNHPRRIAIIDSVMPFLKTLPEMLSTQAVPINTCLNAFTILKQCTQLYLARKDTVKVLEMVSLSRRIWSELAKKRGLDKVKIQHCRLTVYLIESSGARVLSEKTKEREILNAAYQDIISRDNQLSALFKRPFERTILGRLIDYHLNENQVDSSNYYFGIFKDKVGAYKKNESGDGTKFLLYSGKISAKNGDYLAAYKEVLRAYEMNDSIISIKTADIHNNMYAHLVAEQRNEALKTAEEQNEKRNIEIFVIVMLLVFTVAAFLWRLRISVLASKRKIEDLNQTTQIQIAELETHASVVQKKMGMELHDDIAGRLVNICNFIETQALEERDPEISGTLTTIGKMARDAYTHTRLISHDWYFDGLKQEGIAFSKRVFTIVGLALPKPKYETKIEIDDQSMEKLSSETRIHLLRIIQEAVVNILKHAKASKVELFIYEEEGSLVLQITDNGKGFNALSPGAGEGFGLKSLKNREKELNGTLLITSSAKGTELMFNIPV